MNNSKFTTAEVREILPKLLSEEKGVTINTCGYDSFLCELTLLDPITIDSVDEYDGILDIHFSQRFDGDPGFDNLDAAIRLAAPLSSDFKIPMFKKPWKLRWIFRKRNIFKTINKKVWKRKF